MARPKGRQLPNRVSVALTDQQIAALERLVEKYRVDMIQWRNLNYDSMLYFKILRTHAVKREDLVGIRQEIDSLKKLFPKLMMGYFNPIKPFKI